MTKGERFLAGAFLLWLFVIILMTICSSVSNAAEASFSWLPNKESDLAGYKVHYGPSSRQYETVVDVGLPDPVTGRIRYTITDVPAEKTYFAATAYDTEGAESDYSVEVIYDPAPDPPDDPVIVQVTVTVTVQ